MYIAPFSISARVNSRDNGWWMNDVPPCTRADAECSPWQWRGDVSMGYFCGRPPSSLLPHVMMGFSVARQYLKTKQRINKYLHYNYVNCLFALLFNFKHFCDLSNVNSFNQILSVKVYIAKMIIYFDRGLLG